jgi:carbon-monoxide dehydrogenase iron sulfur subunit
MRIKVDNKKCTGCRLCEMVCSLVHLGVINTEKSAIRVQKDDLDSSLHEPIVCRQCKKMICLTDEKVESDRERKAYLWSTSRAERCPFRALNVFADIAYHCDLCGGKPQCVKVCTPKAIYIWTKKQSKTIQE